MFQHGIIETNNNFNILIVLAITPKIPIHMVQSSMENSRIQFNTPKYSLSRFFKLFLMTTSTVPI